MAETKGALWTISVLVLLRGTQLPGAGEDEVISSSSSRARFLRPRLPAPLFAADMLGRKGELDSVVSKEDI
jgi:hypothetical protein